MDKPVLKAWTRRRKKDVDKPAQKGSGLKGVNESALVWTTQRLKLETDSAHKDMHKPASAYKCGDGSGLAKV